MIGYDPSIFRLGKLCLRGHEFENTGLTLKREGRCQKCAQIINAEYCQKNKEKIKHDKAKWHKENKKDRSLYTANYRQSHKEDQARNNAKHYRDNRDELLRKQKERRQLKKSQANPSTPQEKPNDN